MKYGIAKWIVAGMSAFLVACPQGTATEQDAADNVIARDVKGTVINQDGQEVDYNFKSGKDCFSLTYEDNFDYKSLEEMQAKQFGDNGPLYKPEVEGVWYFQTDWNIHPSGVVFDGDGTVKLKVKKLAKNEKPTDVSAEWAPIAETLCGGFTYNREVLYGVIEARIRMHKKQYYSYWPGFYTYANPLDSEGKSIAGYEFDIFEPLDNKEIDQTTHWPTHANRLVSYRHGLPLEFEKWITATVAWTPEKVAYYIDDKLSYVFYNDNRNGFLSETTVNKLRDAGEGKPSNLISKESQYQLVANVPQRIIMVIAASNSGLGWTGSGIPDVRTAPDGWEQVVYEYDWFRYYEYVGTEK